MLVRRVHHVAYRCIDAKETVEWYEKHLGMRFCLAIAEDEVPSTKSPDPYMHVFLDAGQGNVLAFFELPTRPPMDRDRNTPAWVQHLALEVDSVDSLDRTEVPRHAAEGNRGGLGGAHLATSWLRRASPDGPSVSSGGGSPRFAPCTFARGDIPFKNAAGMMGTDFRLAG